MLAVQPTPIGVGPAFHPQPAVHAACARAPLTAGARMHVELFAQGRVIIVPAAIGLRDARLALGRARSARCRASIWTLDPTGVVHFTGSSTLGDLFRVWGARLASARLLSFRGAVRVYRNGVRRRGDARTVALRDGDEIVLEVGPFIPPHRSYRFPPH
ncbi:MAG TPA: hypothetical protein VIG35_04630 [Gaiellaceae bacterium]